MKLLRVLFVLELALGVLWVIPAAMTEHPGLGFVLLFFWIYPLHMVFMGISIYFLLSRPETRPLAWVVLLMPVALYFLPLALRGVFGGAVLTGVDQGPVIGITLLALPLSIFLLLPHLVAQYVPTCVLSSRVFNVSLIVLLLLLLSPWAISYVQVAGPGGISDEVAAILLLSSVLSLLVAIGVLVYSYVGLFQKRDRAQQLLRVVQLVVSVGLVVLALPTTHLVLAIVTGNPG